jgi:cis-3-alkyl-4-acyloxetan-2-one decarboxylase
MVVVNRSAVDNKNNLQEFVHGENPSFRPEGPQAPVDVTQASFASLYPFQSHYFNVGEQQRPRWLHYLDEGPRDAPVVVFLHGNPTWSFYWRQAVLLLRDRFRCIVPDHVGMGLSDRPQDDRYLLDDHIKRVELLLSRLSVTSYALVGHDWGGCIAAGVATRHVESVTSLTFMNTGAFLSQSIPFSIAMVRWPVFGPLAVLRFNAFAGVAAWRAPQHRLTPAVKHGYLSPYGNSHDRIATLRFVEDIPLHPSHPSYATLKAIEERLPLLRGKPTALFWGDKDFCFTPAFRERFQKEFPSAAVHAYLDAGHYVMEDAADRVLPALDAHLTKAVQ